MLMLVSYLAILNPVSAAIIYVDSSMAAGEINTAIDGANNGDTIQFTGGNYDLDSPIIITKSVSLVGNTGSPSSVIMNAPTTGGGQARSVFKVTVSNVNIRGFRIQGGFDSSTLQNAGIYVGEGFPGLSNVTISHNEITANSYGILLNDVKNSTISNNEVWGQKKNNEPSSSGVGIVIFGRKQDGDHTYNVIVENNTIYNNETEGIRIDVESADGSTKFVNNLNIIIKNNKVYNNGSTIGGVDKYIGIKSVGWSKGVIVTNNEIYGHTMKTGASSPNNQSAGIWIAASKDWQIVNNYIHDNLNGIVFVYSKFDAGSGNHIITGNIIKSNVRGISIDDGSEAKANSNDIYSNSIQIFSGLRYKGYEIYNSDITNTFNAQNNWWGSNAGPIGSKIYGKVNYYPWIKYSELPVASITKILKKNQDKKNNK